MAENPIKTPLPADLPEDWVYGQTVGPNGTDVGLTEQHGYNYLMQQVNAAENGINALGNAMEDMPELGADGKVPASQLPLGVANGAASLDGNGKVPVTQIPDLDYDPAGSAAGVQSNLTNHINNKSNPHGVTAAQVGLGNVDNTSDANKPISTATQNALNGKQATVTGGASTITSSNLTASRALVSNGSGKVAASAVTSTELGYLDGVTSNIQTQINSIETQVGASALQKVAEFTVQSAAAEVDFNLSSLNLSSYSAIQLYFDLKFVNESRTNATIKYNDGTPFYDALVDVTSTSDTADTEMSFTVNDFNSAFGVGAKIELFRCKDSIAALHHAVAKYADGFSYGASVCLKHVFLPEISMDELEKVTLSFETDKTNQYAIGSTVRIYGVRK